MPVEVRLAGSWEVLDPMEYTRLLAHAYEQQCYGSIACLLVPFHDAAGMAHGIAEMEASFARTRQADAPAAAS